MPICVSLSLGVGSDADARVAERPREVSGDGTPIPEIRPPAPPSVFFGARTPPYDAERCRGRRRANFERLADGLNGGFRFLRRDLPEGACPLFLPVLVRDYVRTGKLRIVFRGLAFLGPDSSKALRAAHAAGEQNRLWDVVHGLYARQGAENSGWVSDALLAEVAGEIDGLDVSSFRRASARDFGATVRRDLRAAQDAGVAGTPAFQLALNGESPEMLAVTSLGPEGIVPTLDAWLDG